MWVGHLFSVSEVMKKKTYLGITDRHFMDRVLSGLWTALFLQLLALENIIKANQLCSWLENVGQHKLGQAITRASTHVVSFITSSYSEQQ